MAETNANSANFDRKQSPVILKIDFFNLKTKKFKKDVREKTYILCYTKKLHRDIYRT